MQTNEIGSKRDERTRKDFFYVPMPNKTGDEIDRLLDLYGGKYSILSRNEFVRTAVREYIAKIKREEKEEGGN